jgi:4-hydroxythreonine-4-phosphate dehydrogenase
MASRIRDMRLRVSQRILKDAKEAECQTKGSLQILPIPLARAVQPGQLDPENAQYVLNQLKMSVELCAKNKHTALVTAPVQKSTINEAGISFTGHTEWLAQRLGATRPVMMLISSNLRVALATTHLSLDNVPASITQGSLEEVITVLDHDLRSLFSIESPKIMVLGLNPHAGENGTLGKEELEIINPALQTLSNRGLTLIGPVPADTAFTRERLAQCDAVLAMYHDQGLPVIKALAFGQVVNITLGLPIIRTSVDHGTALKLAGSGGARPDSLRQAVDLAIKLATGSR